MITGGYNVVNGKKNVSKFGGFDLGVKAKKGKDQTSIMFTIANKGGSIADDWLGGVAHVIGFDDIMGNKGKYVTSGYFAGSTLVTPIPAALPLFLSGIGILGFMGWRKRRT